jgi:hypothetical protein
MEPELLVVLGKLNKLLDTFTGKKGAPVDDKSSNIIPSQDGSTLPNGNKNSIPISYLKKIGVFFDIGKFQQQATTMKYAKNFALGFLPSLKKTLDSVMAPVVKAISVQSESSDGGGGDDEGKKGGFNLAGVAKSLLIFIPALAAFTYIAKQWGGIEVSAIAKMLGSLTIFLGGMLLFSKSQSLYKGSIISVGSILLQLAGLAGVIMLFKKSLEGWESIPATSLAKVSAIIGGIALITTALGYIPKDKLIVGGIALVGIGLLMVGLGEVLPIIANGLKSVKDVDYPEMGKVAAIIGGIALIAGILGGIIIGTSGIGGAVLAAGAIALVGIGIIMDGLGEVLPKTAEGIKSVKDIDYPDIGKAAVIILGIGGIAAAMGVVSPLIGLGVLAFAGIVEMVDNINLIIPKIVTSIKTVGEISTKTIDDAFNTLKYFMMSAGSLFGGETFLGKAGNFLKGLVGGTAAAVAFAPYVAIATEMTALSLLIKTTISNISQIGGVGIVQNSLNIVKEFIQGAAGVTSVVTTEGINNIIKFTTTLNNLIPSINNFAVSLTFLKTTLSGVSIGPFNSFIGIKTIFDSVTDSILIDVIPSVGILTRSLLDLRTGISMFSTDSFVGLKGAKTTIDSLTDSVNRLKTSFGEIDVKSSINIVSNTPLKVDMTTTNEILYKMYQTSTEMINVMKNLQVGGGNNIVMTSGQRNQGVQPGSPKISGFDGFKGSPYAYR